MLAVSLVLENGADSPAYGKDGTACSPTIVARAGEVDVLGVVELYLRWEQALMSGWQTWQCGLKAWRNIAFGPRGRSSFAVAHACLAQPLRLLPMGAGHSVFRLAWLVFELMADLSSDPLNIPHIRCRCVRAVLWF